MYFRSVRPHKTQIQGDFLKRRSNFGSRSTIPTTIIPPLNTENRVYRTRAYVLSRSTRRPAASTRTLSSTQINCYFLLLFVGYSTNNPLDI